MSPVVESLLYVRPPAAMQVPLGGLGGLLAAMQVPLGLRYKSIKPMEAEDLTIPRLFHQHVTIFFQ